MTGGIHCSDPQKLFEATADRWVCGKYYPEDVIRFSFEGDQLQVGTRILQELKIFSAITLFAMVEITVCERTEHECRIGYVTTSRHFARGEWCARIWQEPDSSELGFEVKAVTCPSSFWFWVGLPIARYYQMRAWRKAIASIRE
jgi:hypothetical protein